MPGQSPQRRMVDINVIETSGVDHPAHGREGWLVKKSASAGRVAALDRLLKGTAMPATKESLIEEVTKSALPDAQKEFLTKAIDLSPDVDAAAKLWQSLRAKQEAGDPEIPTVAEVEDPAAAPAAPAAPVVAAAPAAPADPNDVFKSVSDPAERAALEKALEENPALAKAMAGLSKQATEAMEKAAAEEAIRLDGEAVAKAKVDFAHLAIDHDPVAKSLRQLELIAPTHAAVVRDALTKAEGQLDAADVFKEIGHSRPGDPAVARGESVAMTKAAKIAEGYLAAGTAPNKAAAMAKAFADNPELYAEHEAEGTR